MKTKFQMKLTVFFLLGVILFTFTHCLSNAPMEGDASRKPSSFSNVTPPPEPKTPEEVINMAQVEIGVKTFEEIYQSFSAVTGVPESNSSVLNIYRNVADSLPTSSDVKGFLPSNQVAIAKLAAEFCHELVEGRGDRAGIWPNSDYNVTLANFSSARRMDVIQRMLDAFWGMGVVSDSERDIAEAELFDLMAVLEAGESMTSAGSTRKVMKGACSVALSSAYVVMY